MAEINVGIFFVVSRFWLHDFASTIKTTSVVFGTLSPSKSKMLPSATYEPFNKLQLFGGEMELEMNDNNEKILPRGISKLVVRFALLETSIRNTQR